MNKLDFPPILIGEEGYYAPLTGILNSNWEFSVELTGDDGLYADVTGRINLTQDNQVFYPEIEEWLTFTQASFESHCQSGIQECAHPYEDVAKELHAERCYEVDKEEVEEAIAEALDEVIEANRDLLLMQAKDDERQALLYKEGASEPALF